MIVMDHHVYPWIQCEQLLSVHRFSSLISYEIIIYRSMIKISLIQNLGPGNYFGIFFIQNKYLNERFGLLCS